VIARVVCGFERVAERVADGRYRSSQNIPEDPLNIRPIGKPLQLETTVEFAAERSE
jgi:hypothetical protein